MKLPRDITVLNKTSGRKIKTNFVNKLNQSRKLKEN